MFLPSFGEITIIIIVSVVFFKIEDWVKIIKFFQNTKILIEKFIYKSQKEIRSQIIEIEKEILQNKISKEYDLENKDLHYQVFNISGKKYIYGEDGNLYEVFQNDKNDLVDK